MQGVKQNFDIPLHDIKPIVEIQEYSLYYLLGLSFIASVVLLAIIYLIYRYIKSKNIYNKRKEDFKIINSLDFSDTKKAAYAFTTLGLTFKDDSQRHSEMYNNIVQRLESYKYKKEVEELDKEVLGYIEVYKGMIDV
jgi:hypothetical protein